MKRSSKIATAAFSALAALGAVLGAIGASASAESGALHFQGRQDLGLTVIPCSECTLRPMGLTPGGPHR
jgi:hypothetical protein